ncbi:MAG TPA: Smr/MutS family protein [Bryobacteraceae bacterium]|nr:Smr/MutS family protein [Bryobacteraceae bacterium]
MAPSTVRAEIESALADAAEAVAYLQTASRPQPAARGAAIRLRFGEIGEPEGSIARLRIEGATLEAREIYQITRLLELASETRSILLAARERFLRLGGYASAIADLRELSRELKGKILADGTVTDDASVALARLRRDVERQRRLIQESLERFLRAHHEDGTLQEDFVTIRDDRFVVPVVTGRERGVEGVIHGASGSGHTLFVEPLETINLNNELVRLHEEELREVHRILREFTAQLRARAVEISSTAEALATLDLIFAKADFAIDFQCAVPRLSPEGERRLVLRDARHPLLEDILRVQKKRAIPVSLSLDERERTLLISGPNTGGKTVALKTAGLLALMTQAGLPVPAADAEFPLFEDVLADIGDRQSIQESLSSFSAHIVTLREMLERAGADSLVLLDELGSSTDPEEGGALGVAVVEAFRRLGAFTLVSTHLMALKVYGASTAAVRNGSMGFDEETLEPTYVLRLGAPGKSAGLDIASRLGLDAALIEDARGRMSSAERDVSHFLSELHAKLEELEESKRDVAAQKAELDARERSLESSWEKKYAAKIREVEDRAERMAAEFEQRAQETIGDLSQKARARIAKEKREYTEAVESIAPAPIETKTAAPALRLEEGARVQLKGIRQPATVRRLLAGDLIEVDAGFLKMQVSRSDVEEILPAAGAGARPAVGFRQGPSFDGSYREINVIGQRAEAAVEKVDKMLDNAALAQVERVRIIHGHGMGILKKAIAELLKNNPHVEKFYVAAPEEGGSGATIVELK